MFIVESLQSGYRQGKKTKVLHANVGFALEAGSLLLLAGKNGAGKSTLMQILCGLQQPLSGTVAVNGQHLHTCSVKEKAGLVSMMYAHPPDVPLTLAKEVVFSSRQRFVSAWDGNIRQHEPQILAALEMCGIANLADRQFNTLSDGEKQKVMLARSLAQETPVMLLDEPLAFLDYPARRELLAKLKDWCKELGKTIIYSSHDLELALQHADCMLLLQEDGKHQFIQDRELLSRMDPASLFTA